MAFPRVPPAGWDGDPGTLADAIEGTRCVGHNEEAEGLPRTQSEWPDAPSSGESPAQIEGLE
jgi:hypothetical protein